MYSSFIRNIAVIAHVDHGKTTLIDVMLRQSGIFRYNEEFLERAMDSNDLEREKGITILAKCTSVNWKGVKLNIVDTPGHADFSGEVERILSMIDGVILLVDAVEGPMPQTRFVLEKSLKIKTNIIVVINKIDRVDVRKIEVLDEILELFISLGATSEQLNFPVIYASAKNGSAFSNLNDFKQDLSDLFNTIIEYIPPPRSNINASFSMIATIREYDHYLGKIIIGKIETGVAKINAPVKVISLDGKTIEKGKITKILSFNGLNRLPVEEAFAGDIAIIAGLNNVSVTNTICSLDVEIPLESQSIDPPTLSMIFSVNNSPLAGNEGYKLTFGALKRRLIKEVEGNIAINFLEANQSDSFEVTGRGELQMSVLIENLRREGFEFSVSRPTVVYKYDTLTGERLEPMEEVQIDTDSKYIGSIVESMNLRKAQIVNLSSIGDDKTRLIFIVPSRGLIGYYTQLLMETKGAGVMNRVYHSYAPYCGKIDRRKSGVLISSEYGKAVAYALSQLENRGRIFITPGTQVYKGMIIGQHNAENDLEVNPIRSKKLTNIRATNKEEAIRLTPPYFMILERAISYIEEDELVEVTPKSIRLRKLHLNHSERKKISRKSN